MYPPLGNARAPYVQQDWIVDVTGAVTLTAYQRTIRATANTATDDYAITLPGVAEAAGLVVSIRATIANSKTVTVQDQDDSEDWGGDYDLDTDGDRIVLMSDGRSWLPIFSEIT